MRRPTQRSAARATLALARRESTRDNTLGNLVASETRERNAAKVDTELAALAQARAEQRVAQLNVQRTEVRASTDGIVTNLDLHAGDYLQPGAQALALIDTGSLRIEGYFEETKLGCITEGDAAVARLMGDARDVRGHVETIAAGIADDQRSSTHNLLPAVAPTYTWVRLAQRIPVRIRIDDAPADTRLIVGRTACHHHALGTGSLQVSVRTVRGGLLALLLPMTACVSGPNYHLPANAVAASPGGAAVHLGPGRIVQPRRASGSVVAAVWRPAA